MSARLLAFARCLVEATVRFVFSVKDAPIVIAWLAQLVARRHDRLAPMVILAVAGCLPTPPAVTLDRQLTEPVVAFVAPAITLRTIAMPSAVVVRATIARTCRREVYDLIGESDDGILRRRRAHAASLETACPIAAPNVTVHVTLATGEVLSGVTDPAGVFAHPATTAQLAGVISAQIGDVVVPPPHRPPPPQPPPIDEPIDKPLDKPLAKTAAGPARTFDPAQNQAAFAAMRALVNQCAATHGWGGVVKVRIAIDPAGVAVAESNLGSAAFKTCVRDGASKIGFPASPTGQTLDVKYQIVLPR